MNVLIFGGTGLLGSAAAKIFIERRLTKLRLLRFRRFRKASILRK